MRRVIALLTIGALLAIPTVVLAAEPFTAELSADAEVPAPNVPDDFAGTGEATVTISDDATSIDYEVSFEGLTGDPVGAHIHFGAAGAAGPVILPLDHTSNPMTGTLTEADFVPVEEGDGPTTFAEALEAMRAGNTYINIHTETNAPGEIRGQLNAIPDTAIGLEPASAPIGVPLAVLLLAAAAAFILTLRQLATRRA